MSKVTEQPYSVGPATQGIIDAAVKAGLKEEISTILEAAKANGITTPDDLAILFAIRKAENGAAGIEFGVMHPKARGTNLRTQAGWAAASIVKSRKRWDAAGKPDTFIEFMGKRWAPVGAKNDPTNLNKNWHKNVTSFSNTFYTPPKSTDVKAPSVKTPDIKTPGVKTPSVKAPAVQSVQTKQPISDVDTKVNTPIVDKKPLAVQTKRPVPAAKPTLPQLKKRWPSMQFPTLEKGSAEVIPARELGGLLNATLEHSIQEQKRNKVRLRVALFNIMGGSESFSEKVQRIREIVKLLPENVEAAEQITDPAVMRQLFEQIRDRKHPQTSEGIVVTPEEGTPYKVKNIEPARVWIREVFPGQKSLAGKAAGGFRYSLSETGPVVGEVGSGFTADQRQEMWQNPAEWIGRVAMIETPEQFPSGAYRAPSFKHLHEDYPLSKAAWSRVDEPLTKEKLDRAVRLINDNTILSPIWELPKQADDTSDLAHEVKYVCPECGGSAKCHTELEDSDLEERVCTCTKCEYQGDPGEFKKGADVLSELSDAGVDAEVDDGSILIQHSDLPTETKEHVFDILDGHGMVHKKEAADKPSTTKLTGYLAINDNEGEGDWGHIDLPQSLIEGFYRVFKKGGIPMDKPPYGSHVTAISNDEIKKLKTKLGDGWKKKAGRGKSFQFSIGAVKDVEPKGWDEMDRVYILELRCPELEAWRKSLKLTPKISGHEFHVTLGVRKLGKKYGIKVASEFLDELADMMDAPMRKDAFSFKDIKQQDIIRSIIGALIGGGIGGFKNPLLMILGLLAGFGSKYLYNTKTTETDGIKDGGGGEYSGTGKGKDTLSQTQSDQAAIALRNQMPAYASVSDKREALNKIKGLSEANKEVILTKSVGLGTQNPLTFAINNNLQDMPTEQARKIMENKGFTEDEIQGTLEASNKGKYEPYFGGEVDFGEDPSVTEQVSGWAGENPLMGALATKFVASSGKGLAHLLPKPLSTALLHNLWGGAAAAPAAVPAATTAATTAAGASGVQAASPIYQGISIPDAIKAVTRRLLSGIKSIGSTGAALALPIPTGIGALQIGKKLERAKIEQGRQAETPGSFLTPVSEKAHLPVVNDLLEFVEWASGGHVPASKIVPESRDMASFVINKLIPALGGAPHVGNRLPIIGKYYDGGATDEAFSDVQKALGLEISPSDIADLREWELAGKPTSGSRGNEVISSHPSAPEDLPQEKKQIKLPKKIEEEFFPKPEIMGGPKYDPLKHGIRTGFGLGGASFGRMR